MRAKQIGQYAGATLFVIAVSIAAVLIDSHVMTSRGMPEPAPKPLVSPGTVPAGGAVSTEPMGVWTAPAAMADVVAVHSAMLYTGEVLLWGIWPTGVNKTEPPPYNPAVLVNPTTNVVTSVPQNLTNNQSYMTCAGESILPDGRVFVTGGILTPLQKSALGFGIPQTNFFNPKTSQWSAGPLMNVARWYPTNVTEPDGKVLILSGHDGSLPTPHEVLITEEFDPVANTITELPASANDPDPDLLPYTYPRMELLPSGLYFDAAQAMATHTFSYTTLSWTFVANLIGIPSTNGPGDVFFPGHVLLPNSSKVLIVGGSPSNVNGGDLTTNQTEFIDLSQATPAWQLGPPLKIKRHNAALEWLADGSLIVVGGGQEDHYTNPVLTPEILNLNTGTWTKMAPETGLRDYHSVADLLPDGRLLSAGSTSGATFSNGNPSYEDYYEIFSPPYLFEGTRPTITASPASVNFGKTFTITTPDADTITSVALIRLSTSTHTDDMNQRYTTLNFTIGDGSLTVTAPANGNVAPVGYYMISIVNSSGVPAVMPFIQLGN